MHDTENDRTQWSQTGVEAEIFHISGVLSPFGEFEVSFEPALQGRSGFGLIPKPNQAKTKNIAKTMILVQFSAYGDMMGV